MRKLLILVSTFLLIAGFGLRPTVGAIAITGSQDCDSNAVIRCGLASSSDLSAKFQDSSVDHIYAYFGISQADVNSFNSQAVAGNVTRSGNVIVGKKVVATNALTAGRQNMPGSKAVTSGSVKFYTRPPSVSFQSASLPAYVVMRGGQFDFAIIASCGNPVMATPVKIPPKKPPVTPPSTVTPPPSQTQTQTQSQTVNVTPQVQSATTSLPNTGPGNVLGIGGLVGLASAAGHFLYTRRKTAA